MQLIAQEKESKRLQLIAINKNNKTDCKDNKDDKLTSVQLIAQENVVDEEPPATKEEVQELFGDIL